MKIFANIFISTFVFAFVFSSTAYSRIPTLPKATYVTVEEVKKWDKEGKSFAFIDVRAPVEYEVGHLKDAINMEYNKIEEHVKEFKKDKAYVFYCTYSAWRAPYAANVLADLGFENSFILEGGISAWNAGGQVIYPVNPNADGYIAPYPKGLVKQLTHPTDKVYPVKIYLTLDELSKFDGKDGHPAYVAVNGVIYDLTQSRLWRGGVHDPSKGKATAGRDLTEVLKDSPHGDSHLKDFPVVGYLK